MARYLPSLLIIAVLTWWSLDGRSESAAPRAAPEPRGRLFVELARALKAYAGAVSERYDEVYAANQAAPEAPADRAAEDSDAVDPQEMLKGFEGIVTGLLAASSHWVADLEANGAALLAGLADAERQAALDNSNQLVFALGPQLRGGIDLLAKVFAKVGVAPVPEGDAVMRALDQLSQ